MKIEIRLPSRGKSVLLLMLLMLVCVFAGNSLCFNSLVRLMADLRAVLSASAVSMAVRQRDKQATLCLMIMTEW